MASRYVHYWPVFGQQVHRAPWMYALMLQRAQMIEATAKALAPIGNPDSGFYGGAGEKPAPGEYAASFEVSVGTTTQGGPGSRAYGRVTNTSEHAGAVEWGFSRTPRYRVLGTAMLVAGDPAGE